MERNELLLWIMDNNYKAQEQNISHGNGIPQKDIRVEEIESVTQQNEILV